MRVPVEGGAADEVLHSKTYVSHVCSRGGLCLLVERDAQQRVHYELDPLKGKGRELFRTDLFFGDATISPDAQSIAFIASDANAFPRNRIRIVKRDGRTERELVVAGATFLTSLDWSADGKALYSGSVLLPGGSALLQIDLNGNARTLWRQPGSHETWAIPSPDGKYLALLGSTIDSNAWLVENF
jgi:Tol biopolymer transport system component